MEMQPKLDSNKTCCVCKEIQYRNTELQCCIFTFRAISQQNYDCWTKKDKVKINEREQNKLIGIHQTPERKRLIHTNEVLLIDDDVLTDHSKESSKPTKQGQRLQKTIKKTMNAFEVENKRNCSECRDKIIFMGINKVSTANNATKIPTSKQCINRAKRNAREYVCSILDHEKPHTGIEFTNHKIINRTSAGWMKQSYGTNSDSRPGTTKIIQATKIRSQTAQKDSSVRRTTASTGNNLSNHRFRNHVKYTESENLLFQNSWIPNSYRKNVFDVADRTDPVIPKKIPTQKFLKNTISGVREINPVTSKITIQGNEGNIKKIIPGLEKPQKLEKKLEEVEKKQRKMTPFKIGKIQSVTKYTILEILGKGSYATVYLGRAINSDNKQVAIKIFDQNKKSRSGREEINILKKLNHPCVISFHDEYMHNNKHHIVLELAKGTSLLKNLKAVTRFSEIESKTIFRKILEGVDYLHRSNIAHRDLKLENIIIDKSKNVKIIDFGFATMTTKDYKGRVFCGTPSYMAPEIVAHQTHNYMKADIWALGVILYSLLSGKFPFKAQKDKDLYSKIRKGLFAVPEGITLEAKNILLRKALKHFKGPMVYRKKEEPDTSPQGSKKNIIMGTIEKYKKIYGGNRRNINSENKCASEPRKKTLNGSPYQLNKSPYSQQLKGFLKGSTQYIKTYFKNSAEFGKGEPEDSSIYPKSPILNDPDIFKGFKKNSKSNVQINFKKRIESIEKNNTQLRFTSNNSKNLRLNIRKEIKMDNQKINNFVNSFDGPNNESKRQTFNAYSGSKESIIMSK
ncbi:unnamed protein product [Moneuplotes crassus]|uniref:Protein kinase domain-containing protein n=1 Tax=Euplotes crassus TaxID=5936 RepID=A0AAD1Y6K6_EUPCR|nr:unnamed protein product [Moneuplotes crassus]